MALSFVVWRLVAFTEKFWLWNEVIGKLPMLEFLKASFSHIIRWVWCNIILSRDDGREWLWVSERSQVTLTHPGSLSCRKGLRKIRVANEMMKKIHSVTLGAITTIPSFKICMDFSVFVTITHHQSDHWSRLGGREHQLVIRGSNSGYINALRPEKVDRRWDFDEISNSLQ